MHRMKSVTAFAPATIGNVAVGFDVLGHAIVGPGDRVTVTLTDSDGIEITDVSGVVSDLPTDPYDNTASRALLRMIEDNEIAQGISLSIDKGIPLGSGMGGSAASAVAAVVAANAVLGLDLDPLTLIGYALDGEALTSTARNADNVAPCMLGGLILSNMGTVGAELQCISIPVPDKLIAVVLHPNIEIQTRAARKILGDTVSLRSHVQQSAAHALLIAACYENNLDLIGSCLEDIVIEPQRKSLIPGFDDAKAAALDHGALGCSISGSGPAVFAWCRSADSQNIAAAMKQVFDERNGSSEFWVSPVNAPGACIV